MFWKKKSKAQPPKSANKDGKPTREQIIAQAKANAAKASAEIGEETLDKIRIAMMKKQSQAILDKAKADIMAADTDKVRDHIQFMIRHETPKGTTKK